MASQIVFLTLFLGLTSGPNAVTLQVGPSVRSIRILLDGTEVAALRQAPWTAEVDFGTAVKPAELTAIAYDKDGDEVGRVSQPVNVPRPQAEFTIVVHSNAAGRATGAELRWEHIMGEKPTRATLKVDGRAVPLDSAMRAKLPALDLARAHVLVAEMRFGSYVARREQVIGAGIGDVAEAELTPVAVNVTDANVTKSLDTCFTSGGAPVHVAALENPAALVVFVRDLNLPEARSMLRPSFAVGEPWTRWPGVRQLASLPPESWMRVLWPIAEQYTSTSNAEASMFPTSDDIDSKEGGLLWLLTSVYPSAPDTTKIERRFADAVGVAALSAKRGVHRRAVVLVVRPGDDHSTHDPATIRSYLASLDVPLFVWSFYPTRPELREAWGEVDDISSYDALRAALERLTARLASQRIAWVAAGPVAALHLKPTGRCGIEPLAH